MAPLDTVTPDPILATGLTQDISRMGCAPASCANRVVIALKAVPDVEVEPWENALKTRYHAHVLRPQARQNCYRS